MACRDKGIGQEGGLQWRVARQSRVRHARWHGTCATSERQAVDEHRRITSTSRADKKFVRTEVNPISKLSANEGFAKRIAQPSLKKETK